MKDALEASAQILWHCPMNVFIFIFIYENASEASAQISLTLSH